MSDCFDSEIYIPNINESSSVDYVLKELELFNDNERNQVIDNLKEVELNIGIKKLLMIIEMSRQDVDNKMEKFVDTIKAVNTIETTKNYQKIGGIINGNINEIQLNDI